MAAHSAPSTRRQLRTTALTSIATALAVVGLMFVGSALTTSPPGREPGTLGTTAGPVTLLDAPAASTAPSPTSSAPRPAVRKSEAPRTSAKPAPTTTTKKSTRTTTTTPDDSEE